MIGKYFSNGWKNQPVFPMIGKIVRPFSSDWKKFSGHFRETKRTKRTTKQAADNSDYSRQLFEETTWTTRYNLARSHAKSAKSAKCAGGKREMGIYKNVSNAAARPRMAGRREGCLH
ncbi:MAG: hypothetical protein IKQ15_00660 [Kiritimatiellae bacterium]|nr:hypothetical protein [Kiritimatiellia bacterium]